MKRIQIAICAVYLLAAVSALFPAATNSFVEVVSYEDDQIERSLAGTKCSSSADVQCLLDGTSDSTGPGIPCINNLKIRRSDCLRGPVNQRVSLFWEYCNTDTALQNVKRVKTEAIFKSSKIDDSVTTLQPGQCRSLTREDDVDLCKKGATMRMKYEGTVPSRPSSNCFAFDFLRASTEKLPEKPCSASAEVTCQIPDINGLIPGKPCAGNLINDNNCGLVTVQLHYKICVFNKNARRLILTNKSRALLNGKNTRALTKVPFRFFNKPCRRDIHEHVIDTCDGKDTNAKIILRGKLNTERVCRESDFIRIRVADPCDYNFIITELVSKNSASYIELYSAECRNKVVAEEFQIVRYKKGKDNPSSDNPINLQGLETDKDGFIVLCATSKVEEPYAIKRGDLCEDRNPTTAGLTGKDTIALISGTVNGDPKVLDVFGTIPPSNIGNHDFSKGRIVRKCENNIQISDYIRSAWDFTVPLGNGDTDPRQWCGKGESLPLVTDSEPPAIEPTTSPPIEPTTPCSTRPYITEVVVQNGNVVFIELKAEKTCAYGKQIADDTYFVYPNTSDNLKGKTYNESGYITLCGIVPPAGPFDPQCTGGDIKPGVPTNVDDEFVLKLLENGPVADPGVIDEAILTCREINTCRLVRKEISTTAEPEFVPNSWTRDLNGIVFTPDGPDPMGVERTSSPTVAPTPSATTVVPPTMPEPTSPCSTRPYITEVVVQNGKVAFIELKAEKTCAYGRQIADETRFGFPNFSDNLKGETYNEFGYITLCGIGSPAGPFNPLCNGGPISAEVPTNVDDELVLELYEFGPFGAIIDKAVLTCRENNTCRLVRKNIFTTAEPEFDPDSWTRDLNGSVFSPDGPDPIGVARTSSPTVAPTATSTCDKTPYISEVSFVDGRASFVEFRAEDECAYGQVIDRSFLFNLASTFIQLEDRMYNNDGYLVVCTSYEKTGYCSTPPFSETVLMNGFINGQLLDDANKIVDNVIIKCTEDCRMYRKTGINMANKIFTKSEWVTLHPGTDATPGTGEMNSIVPRTSSPTGDRGPSPSPTYSYGKGQGKGIKSPKSYRARKN